MNDWGDAQSTRRLDEQLLAAHPDTPTSYVLCANARYYNNKELSAWLADQRIEQVFLPPYSPNLNLIERLWILAPEEHQRHVLSHQRGVPPSGVRLLLPTRRVRARPRVLIDPEFSYTRLPTHFVMGIIRYLQLLAPYRSCSPSSLYFSNETGDFIA